MRKITQLRCPSGAIFATVAALAMAAGPLVEAAKHPSLVDPAHARCATCHDETLSGETRHAPAADDCLSCHEFTKGDEGLTVVLAVTGSQLCIMCHDGFEDAAAGKLASAHAPVTDDCATCHNPHSSAFEHLLSGALSDVCSDCHDVGDTDASHGIPVSRANCRSCHDPHGSESPQMLKGSAQHAPFSEGECESCHKKPRGTKVRLREEGAALCYACHGDLEQKFAVGEVHGAVKQGLCTGCHDPHLAAEDKMLMAAGGELCFPCHGDIREKVTGEAVHAAVMDGCDGCHSPHNSEHPKLLLEALPKLCLMCHDGDDVELKAAHLNADLGAAACTTCHDPHGSTRTHLIATGSVHPPFVEGCDTCHEGGATKLMEGGGTALCLACHSAVKEAMESAAMPHAAMEMVACDTCHSPHASPNRKLLRAPAGGVCTTCHDDMVGGRDQYTHGIIDWVGCEACHDPHGGSGNKLLRADGNDLCTGCHLRDQAGTSADGGRVLPGGFLLDQGRASKLRLIALDATRTTGHPITGHPVSGTATGDGRSKIAPSLIGTEIGCRSCHTAHTAASPNLFAYKARTQQELCTVCHPK